VRPLSEAGPGRERKARIAGLREGWAWAPRRWTAITDDTGVGDPSAATGAKGEAFFRAVTERIGGFLADLATADTDDLYAESPPA
jgi:creatinine amidohydrolase